MKEYRIDQLFSVAGKVVLVTGGSRGLGESMARAYAANGARVYISSRKADACEALAAEIRADGGDCIALPADLSTLAEIDRLVAELAARESRLHVLVNNAGATWGAPVATFPESGWDKVIDLNLKAPFFMIQRTLPLLEAAATDADWARVINIASVSAFAVRALQGAPSYTASKAGLAQLTRLLAFNLAPNRIAINAIAPGFFPTKMAAGLLETIGKETLEATPMKRNGAPTDIGAAALYLGSPASAFVTGIMLTVDGGLGSTA